MLLNMKVGGKTLRGRVAADKAQLAKGEYLGSTYWSKLREEYKDVLIDEPEVVSISTLR